MSADEMKCLTWNVNANGRDIPRNRRQAGSDSGDWLGGFDVCPMQLALMACKISHSVLRTVQSFDLNHNDKCCKV